MCHLLKTFGRLFSFCFCRREIYKLVTRPKAELGYNIDVWSERASISLCQCARREASPREVGLATSCSSFDLTSPVLYDSFYKFIFCLSFKTYSFTIFTLRFTQHRMLYLVTEEIK